MLNLPQVYEQVKQQVAEVAERHPERIRRNRAGAKRQQDQYLAMQARDIAAHEAQRQRLAANSTFADLHAELVERFQSGPIFTTLKAQRWGKEEIAKIDDLRFDLVDQGYGEYSLRIWRNGHLPPTLVDEITIANPSRQPSLPGEAQRYELMSQADLEAWLGELPALSYRDNPIYKIALEVGSPKPWPEEVDDYGLEAAA